MTLGLGNEHNGQVAPLAGSVDRNLLDQAVLAAEFESLPSRGAWIEIRRRGLRPQRRPWSLPSRGAWIEILSCFQNNLHSASLPSRGAWIEILLGFAGTVSQVSLPSRGAWIEMTRSASSGLPAGRRSPRGERG